MDLAGGHGGQGSTGGARKQVALQARRGYLPQVCRAGDADTVTRGGPRPGAGRPRKDSKAATTTVYLSAETRAALTATLRRGESRSAYVAAAIEREAAARRDEATERPRARKE